MRKWGLFAGLMCVAVVCPAARAGLYMPAEPLPWPLPSNPKHYLLFLQERQNVGATDKDVKDSPLRARVKQLVERLEPKRKTGRLTAEEATNLGACYVLQGKYSEAVEVLEPAARQERRNFMLSANLAVAYAGLQEYGRAYEFQQNALDIWPGQQPGWTPEQLRWYRRAEEYFRTLLRLRRARSPQQAREFHLDALFPEVNTLGAGAAFQPGRLDPKLAANLPPDGLAIVEQMLLGMPHDRPLLWLFAELVNGQGELRMSEQILSQLAREGLATEGLKKHRQALQEAIEAADAPPSPPDPPLPNWRHIAVGFASGVVVGMLVLFQLRQFGRRPARAPAHPPA